MASIPACPEKPARRWRPLHGVFRGPGEKGSSGFGPPKRVRVVLHSILILRILWSMDLMKPSEGPQPSKCSVLVSASLSRPCFGRGRADFSSGDDCSAHSLCVCCRRGRRCFPSLFGLTAGETLWMWDEM